MQRETAKLLIVIKVHQESTKRTTLALGRGAFAQKPEKPTEVNRQSH